MILRGEQAVKPAGHVYSPKGVAQHIENTLSSFLKLLHLQILMCTPHSPCALHSLLYTESVHRLVNSTVHQYRSSSLLPSLTTSASSSPSWRRALALHTYVFPSSRSFNDFMARKGLRSWSMLLSPMKPG